MLNKRHQQIFNYALNQEVMTTRMKSNIVLVLAILLMGLLCGSIFAQAPQGKKPPVPNDEQIEKMIEDLSNSLSLNVEQEKEFRETFQNHFNEVKKHHESARKQHEKMKTKHDKLRDDFHKELSSILNEEQLKVFEQHMKKHKPKERHPKK